MLFGSIGLLAACEQRAKNFSQHPGFREWYADHPPLDSTPGAADRMLLERFRPRLFVAAGAEGPISFYGDYIAQGTLYDGAGRQLANPVARATLNALKHDPRAVFVHRPSGTEARAVVYGRVDRELLPAPADRRPTPLTFLTYNFVFRHSGLPAGLPGWQEFAIGLLADPTDWHQLDHYTAVTIVLASAAESSEPVAAIFQHHNYLRAFLLSRDVSPGRLALPDDWRLPVDAAIRSNELYPHLDGRQVRRAVRYLDGDTARYLATGADRPWLSADDITDPAREIDYALEFLPPSDAFYVFQGWLGERRSLPGRDGPPGADYHTVPRFKSRVTQLALFRWMDGELEFSQRLSRARDPETATATLRDALERLSRDIACTRPIAVACRP